MLLSLLILTLLRHEWNDRSYLEANLEKSVQIHKVNMFSSLTFLWTDLVMGLSAELFTSVEKIFLVCLMTQ